MENLIYSVFTFVFSAGFYTFVQFLIKRHDDKKGKIAHIDEKIDGIHEHHKRLEKDATRTQLLVLMACYEKNAAEIMRLAEHYFSILNGDWYMTGLFNNWLERSGIGKPEWFNSEG